LDILAGVLGICAGLIGIVPFIILSKLMHSHSSLRGMGMIPAGLIGTLLSFVMLAAALFACATVAREQLIVFTIACIGVFLIGTIVFAWRIGRPTSDGEDLS
jgi:hypothetical protein